MAWRYMVEWMYRFTFSWPWHWLEVSCQLHAPAALPSGGGGPGTHWVGWVDPRAILDNAEKRKFLTLPGLEVQPLGHPAHSQSLYWLCYPDSHHCQSKVLLCIGYEVLTVVVMSSVFWDIVLCSLMKGNWHFGGIYYLHIQGWNKLRKESPSGRQPVELIIEQCYTHVRDASCLKQQKFSFQKTVQVISNFSSLRHKNSLKTLILHMF
jgi:hypothetical protein